MRMPEAGLFPEFHGMDDVRGCQGAYSFHFNVFFQNGLGADLHDLSVMKMASEKTCAPVVVYSGHNRGGLFLGSGNRWGNREHVECMDDVELLLSQKLIESLLGFSVKQFIVVEIEWQLLSYRWDEPMNYIFIFLNLAFSGCNDMYLMFPGQ